MDYDMIAICMIGIIGVFLITSVGIYKADYDAHCVYKNYSANVTEHYDDTYTTIVPVSNGKTTSCVPIFHHDYYIIADNQKFSVSYSFWDKIKVNDTIQLTKNLNNSDVKINYDYYET